MFCACVLKLNDDIIATPTFLHPRIRQRERCSAVRPSSRRNCLVRWPRGALDAISDLRRDFQTSDFGRDFTVAERGIGLDFRSPTWFQTLDAIFRLQTSDFGRDFQISDFGRDFLTSDSIFFIPTARRIFPISGRGSVQVPGESIHEH